MSEYTASPLGLLPDNKNYIYDGTNSQFSTKNYLRKKDINEGGKGLSINPLSFSDPSILHTNDVYDISTSNIITQLDSYNTMRLKWADFAYCRDYGVYTNNRLIICRRFPQPVIDDLTFIGSDGSLSSEYGNAPISTLISWFDDSKNILEFDFGEEWVPSEAAFKDLLNDVGKDMGMKGALSLGDIVNAAINVVPGAGATEGLQRVILEKLGFIEPGNADIIPSGTPNLIKESKQRSLLKDDQPGSGLKGKFNISVKCAWEQKFISGVDPTFVYYDILQTILSFGGSSAVFYLGKKSNLSKLDSKLQKLLKPGGAIEIVKEIAEAFKEAIDKIKDKINKLIHDAFDSGDSNSVDDSKTPSSIQREEQANRNQVIKDAQDKASKILGTFVNTIVKKYRISALGIVTSLTGLPSTPWHVTLGNPLRPIFSSGDMLCDSVSVNLGPQLSFNDLPSYIECEFKLISARNLGIDEIMEKLNCGGIRVIHEEPTFWNTIVEDKSQSKNPQSSTPLDNGKAEDTLVTASQSNYNQSKIGNIPSTNLSSTTGQSINPDPNSSDPILGKTELPTSNDEEYTVKNGDSMRKIAKSKLGPNATNDEVNAKMKDIISKNKSKNPQEADSIVQSGKNSDPDFINPGDKLIV